MGLAFLIPNERKCLSSFPASLVWLGSAPGMEQRGSVGVRRGHGFRDAIYDCEHRAYCWSVCLFVFGMSLLKWTKVFIKLISCVNFFFCMWL